MCQLATYVHTDGLIEARNGGRIRHGGISTVHFGKLYKIARAFFWMVC